MTNEFAIALLKQDIQNSKINISYRHNEVGIKALELAIKALEQQPSEDCISRAEALHACCDEWNKDYKAIMKSIRQLPSVTPQPKIGHWEWIQYDSNLIIGNWHCSECRMIIPHMPEELDGTPIYKWCPMCGAKMEVEE